MCAVTNWTPDECEAASQVELNIYEARYWRERDGERQRQSLTAAALVGKDAIPPTIHVMARGASGRRMV